MDRHGDVAWCREGVEDWLVARVAVLDVVTLMGFPGHLFRRQAHRVRGRRGFHLKELDKQLGERLHGKEEDFNVLPVHARELSACDCFSQHTCSMKYNKQDTFQQQIILI